MTPLPLPDPSTHPRAEASHTGVGIKTLCSIAGQVSKLGDSLNFTLPQFSNLSIEDRLEILK